MSVSRTKSFLTTAAFLAAFPAFASSAFAEPAAEPSRDASFLPDSVPISVPTFSGLASPGQPAPDPTSPPAVTPVTGPSTASTPFDGKTIPVIPVTTASTPSLAPVLVPPPVAVPAAPIPTTIAPPPPAQAATAAPTSMQPPASIAALTRAAPVIVPLSSPPSITAAPPSPPGTAPAPLAISTPAPTAPEKAYASTPTIETAPLPNLGPESLGVAGAASLGAGIWKGTPRILAERLLSIAPLTTSPVINGLVRRLLVSAAAPPDGNGTLPNLTALRIQKLIEFGDTPSAWSLATHTDIKSLDDSAFHSAVDYALADMIDVCARLPDFAMMRDAIDWQKDQFLCQIRTNNTKAAQVTLDVMRARGLHDEMFLEVAGKNMLGGGSELPHQLTPLTSPMLALLRLTDLPLPSELYGHPDFGLVPSLLRAKSKQDVAQLGLAERAVQRGVIAGTELGDVYKQISFTKEELASPITASESGSRQRALLYQAALADKDPQKQVSYIVRFIQSATPALLNNIGPVLADMMPSLKVDPAYADSAIELARANMLAGRNEIALQWLRLAPSSRRDMSFEEYRTLWPQFALAGLESAESFSSNLSAWLDATFKADTTDGQHNARNEASAALLLLETNGFAIAPEVWTRLIAIPRNEKHITLPPALFERLQAAGSGQRQAETILLAAALAGDGDISLPAAIAISRALVKAGFRAEAASFARQILALAQGS